VQIKSLNESCEAYTGNYAGRKGVRTALKQYSLVIRFREAVDDPVNARRNQYKRTVKWGGSGGTVGVRERGMYREEHQELGRFIHFLEWISGREVQQYGDRPMDVWKSDHLIVL
jgi:hypothetical protein